MAAPRRGQCGDLFEGVVVSLITPFATLTVFTEGPWQHFMRMEMSFTLTLPLSWLTLRFSLRSAYSLFSAVVAIATAGTVAGGGPFNMAGLDRPLTVLSVLLVLLSSNMLLIAALLSEQRKAVQASRAKSSFLATMSRELRTPLNAMMGFADAIRSGLYGPPGHPKYVEYAGHIRDSGQYLLSLINDLLDLARIEAGRSELSLTAVDLHRAAEETVATMESLAAAGGPAIRVDGRTGMVVAKGDARAVRQILLNLLSKTIKFSPPGGRVTVATAGGAGSVGPTVRNEGPGMSKDELKTALEPFGRIKSSQNSSEKGAGLGLPVAMALAESMGGELTITSRKDRGTAVTRDPAAVQERPRRLPGCCEKGGRPFGRPCGPPQGEAKVLNFLMLRSSRERASRRMMGATFLFQQPPRAGGGRTAMDRRHRLCCALRRRGIEEGAWELISARSG